MKNKEVIDGLKSALQEKISSLEGVQAEGVLALNELDEARKSGDAGLVSDASAKVDRVGDSIKSAHKAVEDIQEQMGWFREYGDVADTKSSDEARVEEMRDLFESLKSGVSAAETKKTVGEYFADILEYRGIKRGSDIKDRQAATTLTALIGKDPNAKEILEGKTSVKSIYSNHGVQLVDSMSNPVPGFVGFQCGLVEDLNITCLIEPPPDDFEECISQATLSGNRLRFTREVSRTDHAATVLETAYNPYATLQQNGTKPEGLFTLATVEVPDSKIAEFVVASDEVLEDCSSVASLIDQFLISGINAKKRQQLIGGSGLNGQMRGILNQPDVLTRTHRDTGNGGLADDNIYDTFRRSLTDLWYQSAKIDNVCVVMNPRDAEIIDLTKDELGRYLFNDTDCFNRNLRCLKIRYSVDVPQGTAVLGEFANNWVFYTRKALDIRMGYTGDQFITNTNTILGEMRGLSILRCPRKVLKATSLS